MKFEFPDTVGGIYQSYDAKTRSRIVKFFAA